MLRNRPIITIAAILFSLFGQAQKRHPSGLNLRGADQELWNFGILFNLTNYGTSYTIENPPIDATSLNIFDGIAGGFRLVAEHRILERIDLRIEPGIILNRAAIGNPEGGITEVQLPLLIKYQGERHANYNPFILGGYLASYKTSQELESWTIPYHRLMHSIELGAGVDFYLKKSKLALGVRMITPIVSDQKDSGISTLKDLQSKAVLFTISFETKDGWKLYAR
ncbi:MAG: hypothetical protein DA439_04645 [Bacteroidetes bacterium]|nr:MAG: hypothetical protein DA439_04645 [Bacteroidota bacterium]